MSRRQASLTSDWQNFAALQGASLPARLLGHIVGKRPEEIEKLRQTNRSPQRARKRNYEEVFAAWHGRPPTSDQDYPVPTKSTGGHYEWLANEKALLATLVGTMDVAQIAATLSVRLANLTGDCEAARSKNAVQAAMSDAGLVSRDFVGGISIRQAGNETGSINIINQAIASGNLKAVKRGRMVMIEHAEWERWKQKRSTPPADFVRLASIRELLGIKSDKLSEFARMGYIDTAERFNPFGVAGAKNRNTKFGTWYIAKTVAQRLVADRRAGLAMPWHGKDVGNLKTTWKRFCNRKHPAECLVCREIWGKKGPPATYEDYAKWYPALAIDQKRHLTISFSKSRGPAPEKPRVQKRWINLKSASRIYLYPVAELKRLIAAGELRSSVLASNANRGDPCVLQTEVAKLRHKQGFTEARAARLCGVTVTTLRSMLPSKKQKDIARSKNVTLEDVRRIQRIVKNDPSISIECASTELGRSVSWIRQQCDQGKIRIKQSRKAKESLCLTPVQLEKLRALANRKEADTPELLDDDWMLIGRAAVETGVSIGTLQNAYQNEELEYRMQGRFRYFHQPKLRAWARRYWETNRHRRAIPPAWLIIEGGKVGASQYKVLH